MKRRLAIAGALGGLLAAGAWLGSTPPSPSPAPPAATNHRAIAAAPPLAPTPAAAAATPPGEPAAAVEHRLFTEGSLRDAAADGGWAVDGVGRLRPDIGVRRRFDQLLTASGEASDAALASVVRLQAARDLPPAAVDEVMALWSPYLQLVHHRFEHPLVPADVSTWQAALDESVRVRRELLGVAWADAFYRDEEAALQAHIARRSGTAVGSPAATATALPEAALAPAPGADRLALQQRREAEFGAAAAQRLQQLDEDEAAWQTRLDAARARLAELQRAPELSSPQRQQAIKAELAARFQGGERLRAAALLGVDG